MGAFKDKFDELKTLSREIISLDNGSSFIVSNRLLSYIDKATLNTIKPSVPICFDAENEKIYSSNKITITSQDINIKFNKTFYIYHNKLGLLSAGKVAHIVNNYIEIDGKTIGQTFSKANTIFSVEKFVKIISSSTNMKEYDNINIDIFSPIHKLKISDEVHIKKVGGNISFSSVENSSGLNVYAKYPAPHGKDFEFTMSVNSIKGLLSLFKNNVSIYFSGKDKAISISGNSTTFIMMPIIQEKRKMDIQIDDKKKLFTAKSRYILTTLRNIKIENEVNKKDKSSIKSHIKFSGNKIIFGDKYEELSFSTKVDFTVNYADLRRVLAKESLDVTVYYDEHNHKTIWSIDNRLYSLASFNPRKYGEEE
jgi:hypothetical protein